MIFNHQVPPFDNQDVRWALALMIDIRSVAMGSYRGAANIAALSVPPTGTAVADYFEPMQEWLGDFELDTGTRKIKPYDPTVAEQIAALVRPQWGEQISDRPDRAEGDVRLSAGGSRTSRRRPSCWRRPASPRTATSG